MDQEEDCSELENLQTTAENIFPEQHLEVFQNEGNQSVSSQVGQKEKSIEAPPLSRNINTRASRNAHQKAKEINQSILKKRNSQKNH